MVLEVPPDGFREPTFVEGTLYVLLNPDRWILAVAFALVSLVAAMVLMRLRPSWSRSLTTLVATLSPLALLELAVLIFGAGEAPSSVIAAAFSEWMIALELGVELLVGFGVAGLAVSVSQARTSRLQTEVFE